MPLLPYEILLRFDDAGNFRAGHTIRRDSVTGRLDDPKPIGDDTQFPWPTVLQEIKDGTAAHVADLQASLVEAQNSQAAAETELEQTRAFAADIINRAKAALSDDEISDEERMDMLVTLVAEASKPANQRAADALAAEIAAKQAELDALQAQVAE